ncbi:hypothetical protein D8Y22_11740 [Salinadaptatus halalkaliphilus]|uniref:Uncharacterized protein n=1 Tax=Salinadaptatus halalkaliphilus TaxID=2419781 RepID=A0A4S3TKL1_9EURY|nr:hypothetical protein D8Y22_11740 [Salinadaptatus halalkaliphilus]
MLETDRTEVVAVAEGSLRWPGVRLERPRETHDPGKGRMSPVTDRERPKRASGPTTDVNERLRTA